MMLSGKHAQEGPPDGSGIDPVRSDQPVSDEAEGMVGEGTGQRHGRRRASTAPVPGSDPFPMHEPPRHPEDENDARLRAEKPPHY